MQITKDCYLFLLRQKILCAYYRVMLDQKPSANIEYVSAKHISDLNEYQRDIV